MEENLPFKSDFLWNINFIHEVKIYNELQNNKKILIFDLRKKEEKEFSSLNYTINIPYNEHPDDFFKIFEEEKFMKKTEDPEVKDMLRKYRRFYIVIVMSEEKIARRKILKFPECDGDESLIIRRSLLLYNALTKKRVRELGLFNLGFKKFAEHYGFLIRCKGQDPTAKYFIFNFY
jgi:hypothetical protein